MKLERVDAPAGSPPRARPLRETLFAAAFFLAVTVLMTWPQAAHLDDALSDVGDAKLVTRILQWDFAQTLRDPRQLFQLNFFHPARYVLAFSENLYGVSVFGFPILALGGSPLLNYNVLLLLGMFLSALSAWAVARYLTGDPLTSAAAGIIYAFLPWRMEQIPHLQFQWAPFLCLMLLFLLRYLDAGRRRDLVLYGIAFAWNALANVHYAIFSGFLVGATISWSWLRRREERGRRSLAVAVTTAVASLPFLPFAAGYRAAERLYGFKRSIGEIRVYSGQLKHFLSAGERNHLWGSLTRPAPERQFFPGVIALGLALFAVVLLWRRRSPAQTIRETASPGPRRHRLARVTDGILAFLALLWLVSLLRPDLTIGPLGLKDPGRVFVILAVVALVRVCLEFPGGRFGSLADALRSRGLEPRAALLLAIGGTGVFLALGTNTPFYRFLVQTFGFVFRAIRVPARGIVLFDLALGVFAAWGLSLLTRGRPPGVRRALAGAAVALLLFEYRAFPLPLFPTPATPPAVYRWMRAADFPGAAVEWPLGLHYDFDYVLWQTSHEKPILNGYSGFFPQPYIELETLLTRRPVPDEVWSKMRSLGAGMLVYHPHGILGPESFAYLRLVRNGLAQNRLELLGSALHGNERDFVFRIRNTSLDEGFPTGFSEAERADAAARLQALFDQPAAHGSSPFGVIHIPAEGSTVPAGSWGMGWALDDSGIAEIRIGTELGPSGLAQVGAKWPGLVETFPEFPEAERGGYGFEVPDVPPGPHELTVTFVARDGGVAVLRRSIVVRARKPTPTGAHGP